jgi:exonuclease SbcC
VRPERLTVRNFLGLKNVDIEFQSGITVVEGPNGAGKSSLFEAISFALFGNGIRYPNSYDYVNKNAVDGTARLVFQFERGGKRYEIIREINALQRKHNAKLSEILENGKKAAIAAKPTSVKQEVEKILGIEHRTFIRTVFLPQGEIDKLLTSPPSEITEIISDVFQSKETLEKLEKLLKEKMKKLENGISSLQALYAASWKYLEENDLEVLKSELKTVSEKKKELLKKREELQKEEEQLKRLLEKYRELVKKKERLKVLSLRKNELQKEVVHEQKVKKAKELEPLFRELYLRQREFERLSQDLNSREERYKELEKKKEAISKEIPVHRERLSKLEEMAENLNEELDLLEKVLKVSRPFLEQRIRLKENLTRLEEEIRRLVGEKEKREKELLSIEKTENETKDELEKLLGELSVLKKDHMKWLAYQIASSLNEGDTCPVCGGVFHGKMEAVEFNVDEFEKLDQKRSELENTLNVLKERKKSLSSLIEDFLMKIEEGKKNLKSIRNQIEKIDEELHRLGYSEDLEEKLDEKRKKLRKIEEERHSISQKITAAGVQISQIENQMEEIKEEIEAKRKTLKEQREEIDQLKRDFFDRLREIGIGFEEFRILVKEEVKDAEKELGIVETEIRLLEESLKELESENVRDVSEDYERVRNQLEALSQEISDFERKEGRLNHLIEETLRREQELKSLEKKLEELSDEYNNLDLLRKYLFDKSNFSRYFTGRVLEAVLKRTRAYLDILTNGRFDIDFDDEKGGFIIKDWGIERPARGLSGGERALISISLAMSLAEVASGRLDAFFIDEGFSSLDTENKEKIASVLKELERLNKVIVFITHDREFSEAFDRKLRIMGGVVVNE